MLLEHLLHYSHVWLAITTITKKNPLPHIKFWLLTPVAKLLVPVCDATDWWVRPLHLSPGAPTTEVTTPARNVGRGTATFKLPMHEGERHFHVKAHAFCEESTYVDIISRR